MSEDQPEEVGDMCRIAIDSAIERGAEMCDDPEALSSATRPFFGLDRFEDIDHENVLSEGIDAASSVSAVNRWAHCRAMQLVDEEGVEFMDAIAQAWDEADEKTSLDAGDMADELDDELGVDIDDVEVEDSPLG